MCGGWFWGFYSPVYTLRFGKVCWEGAAPTLSYTSNPARAAHLRRLIDERRLGTLAMHMEHGPVELSGDAALLDDYYARAWCLGIMLLDSDQVAVERGLKRLIADARVGQRTVEATGSGREMLEQLGSRYFERHPEDMEDLWQRTARRLAGG